MGVRASLLPIEHLDAELLAWPFASRTAFQKSLVGLESNMGAGTGGPWREAEKELLGRFPGISVDELVLRRDRIWFGRANQPSRALMELLRDAGKLVLAPVRQGSGIESGPRDRRRERRWIAFALPPDLLFSPPSSTRSRTPGYQRLCVSASKTGALPNRICT